MCTDILNYELHYARCSDQLIRGIYCMYTVVVFQKKKNDEFHDWTHCARANMEATWKPRWIFESFSLNAWGWWMWSDLNCDRSKITDSNQLWTCFYLLCLNSYPHISKPKGYIFIIRQHEWGSSRPLFQFILPVLAILCSTGRCFLTAGSHSQGSNRLNLTKSFVGLRDWKESHSEQSTVQL